MLKSLEIHDENWWSFVDLKDLRCLDMIFTFVAIPFRLCKVKTWFLFWYVVADFSMKVQCGLHVVWLLCRVGVGVGSGSGGGWRLCGGRWWM